MKNIVLSISGMSCESCVSAIEKVLSEIKQIVKFKVDLEKAQAEIESDENLDLNNLIENIENIGFDVKLIN